MFAKAFGVFVALVIVFGMARGSSAIGALLVLAALALGVAVVVGRFVGSAPPALGRVSRWLLAHPKWLSGTIAVMFVGGGMVLSSRGEGMQACKDAMSNTRAARARGADVTTVDDAYIAAAQACADINLQGEASELDHNGASPPFRDVTTEHRGWSVTIAFGRGYPSPSCAGSSPARRYGSRFSTGPGILGVTP